ncbi:MAG: SCO family protein, partial [Blastocatellia bacterium]
LKEGSPDAIPKAAAPDATSKIGSVQGLKIPDTPVLDQDGKRLHFYTDLVKGKTVVIDFIFTTCTTICPPLTATLRKVQKDLGDRVGKDIWLISVTVDPATDIPPRLKDFASKFDVQPGWTFVTGAKPDLDKLLVALGGYTSNPTDHSPIILIGNDSAGYWTRTYGLAPPAKLKEMIGDAAGKTAHDSAVLGPSNAAPDSRVPQAQLPGSNGAAMSSRRDVAAAVSSDSSSNSKTPLKSSAEIAAHYLPDNLLVTQDGKQVRFYSDLVKNKVVLIDFMFTTCTGICPAATANLAKVQSYLGSRVGNEVNMISITVDPKTDTPEKLKQYAALYKTGPGWYFLTGEQANVDAVLHKLGGYVPDPNDHSTFMIVGNPRTGDWAKIFAMTKPAEIVDVILRLIDATSKVEQAN